MIIPFGRREYLLDDVVVLLLPSRSMLLEADANKFVEAVVITRLWLNGSLEKLVI